MWLIDIFFDYLLKITLFFINAFIRGLIILAEKIFDLVTSLIEYGNSSGASESNQNDAIVGSQRENNYNNNEKTYYGNARFVSQIDPNTKFDETINFDKKKIIRLEKKMNEAKMLMYIFIAGSVMFVGISLFFYIDSCDIEGAITVALFAIVSILCSIYQNHRRNKIEMDIDLEFLNK